MTLHLGPEQDNAVHVKDAEWLALADGRVDLHEYLILTTLVDQSIYFVDYKTLSAEPTEMIAAELTRLRDALPPLLYDPIAGLLEAIGRLVRPPRLNVDMICAECDGRGWVLDAPAIGPGTYKDECPQCCGSGQG